MIPSGIERPWEEMRGCGRMVLARTRRAEQWITSGTAVGFVHAAS